MTTITKTILMVSAIRTANFKNLQELPNQEMLLYIVNHEGKNLAIL